MYSLTGSGIDAGSLAVVLEAVVRDKQQRVLPVNKNILNHSAALAFGLTIPSRIHHHHGPIQQKKWFSDTEKSERFKSTCCILLCVFQSIECCVGVTVSFCFHLTNWSLAGASHPPTWS